MLFAPRNRSRRVERVAGLTMTVFCLAVTASAIASRHPTESERSAITRAASRTPHAGHLKVHVSRIRVSTVGSWASAVVTIYDANVPDSATDILHKVQGKWIVASTGTSGEWCVMPRKDVQNLGFPVSYPCAPPAAEGSCRTVTARHQAVHVMVGRGRVSCAQARAVANSYISGHGTFHEGPSQAATYITIPGGWKCSTEEMGGAGCTSAGSNYLNARDVIEWTWTSGSSYYPPLAGRTVEEPDFRRLPGRSGRQAATTRRW